MLRDPSPGIQQRPEKGQEAVGSHIKSGIRTRETGISEILGVLNEIHEVSLLPLRNTDSDLAGPPGHGAEDPEALRGRTR